LNNVIRKAILPQPALQGDSTTGRRILWELLLCKPVCSLVVPSILSIENVRENSMARRDEVHGASERKEVRRDIHFERIISREVESAGLATPTVKKDFSIF
jgi:hypothetical protein